MWEGAMTATRPVPSASTNCLASCATCDAAVAIVSDSPSTMILRTASGIVRTALTVEIYSPAFCAKSEARSETSCGLR